MNTSSFKPRRSCLYVPGDNSRAIEKAVTLQTDVVILDLEDAVSPEAKVTARDAACSASREKIYGDRETVIRINGIETPWGRDDLRKALAAEPDSILVPKIATAQDVETLESLMQSHRASSQVRLWIMIELPEAILNIATIGKTALSTRLSAFVMGTNDLAKETRAILTPERQAFQYALSISVFAARANNLFIIDGVYNEIGNPNGLKTECEQGKTLGFDGKTLIHPSQIEVCNEVFSPAESNVAQAEAVISAFAKPENSDKGVVKVNGKMTERLHLEQARRLVSVSEAIKLRNQHK